MCLANIEEYRQSVQPEPADDALTRYMMRCTRLTETNIKLQAELQRANEVIRTLDVKLGEFGARI